MRKQYNGNEPSDGKLLHTFGDWSLYLMDQKGEYVNLKLVYIGRRERKANFWLAFDKNKNKFVTRRDLATLKAHHLALHDDILNWLFCYRWVTQKL
jgi:hypothetical protein